MRRFRVLRFDFDTRVHILTREIQDHWEERNKELLRRSRAQVERGLVQEFGELATAQKRQNFIDLGPKPLSILAFHNGFLEQIRVGFVMGAYYPALTAACSLGERILNYLILTLREDFKQTPEYKRVYGKDSFDDWDLAIDTLVAWDVLLPEAADEFRTLRDRRTEAIHFRPEVDRNDRALALAAIRSLSSIVGSQFGAFGRQPWFLSGVPGEVYIKKDWESRPYIRRVYLPNCVRVGPRHKIESLAPLAIRDEPCQEREITDEEFCDLRRANRSG
jgi:hypothetical protein